MSYEDFLHIMNEFSHLLESQNSVIITDLLFVFSLSFLQFYNQIRVFHFSGIRVELCILRDGFTARQGSMALLCWRPAGAGSQERVLAKVFSTISKLEFPFKSNRERF